MQELVKAGCKVVVVAAGIVESGRKWLDDYKLTVPLLVNPGRELYRFLGCRRSVTVWSLENIISYSEDRVAGVPPSASYAGDDVHLMGGDYMVDDMGRLVLVYHSATPQDRPTVELIASCLGR